MKPLFKLLTHAGLLAFAFSASADADDNINVMTLNQYLGADLAPITIESDIPFNDRLVAVLKQTALTDFRARARAQADAIAKRSPDVLALQEAWSLRCKNLVSIMPADAPVGCKDPSIADAFTDHLALTLAALKKKGTQYKTVARVKNLDLEKINFPDLPPGNPGIPFVINGVPALLVAVDQDAILVRDGLQAAPVMIPKELCPAYTGSASDALRSADGCNYQVAAPAQTPVGPIRIERGFLAVDVNVAGKGYRVFDTHLEVKGEDVGIPELSDVQAYQASQLIQAIGALTDRHRKTLLLGDMNSSPVQADPEPLLTPYHQFTAAGYSDIWELRPGDVPGDTCCQKEDLLNRKSLLKERIDMIFAVYDPSDAKKIRVIGDNASTKTQPGRGLWFSDHGAVAAQLEF